jgi:hypothetical protein
VEKWLRVNHWRLVLEGLFQAVKVRHLLLVAVKLLLLLLVVAVKHLLILDRLLLVEPLLKIKHLKLELLNRFLVK